MMTDFKQLQYEHRADALVCYDHPEDYCCVCGEHQVIGHREHLAEILEDVVAEIVARSAEAFASARIVCPVHKIPDCSPLLNGCSIPNHIANWRNEVLKDE